MDSLAKKNYLSELKALDWSFDGVRRDDGLDGYHWYPARYVSHVPGVLIGYFSDPGDVVLDPFCGSGTTLVEGLRQGRRVIGIDTNPIAVMMAQAKLRSFDPTTWGDYVAKLADAISTNRLMYSEVSASPLRPIPNQAEQEQWYHPETLSELSAIWDAIHAIGGAYEDVGELAFSAILRFSCSQDKHWGWICDNVKPKILTYKPATKLFLEKLKAFPALASSLKTTSAAEVATSTPDSTVLAGRCQEVLDTCPPASVDLIVTSPPYFSMTDYVRSQRLSFLWFDWDLDTAKRHESGARYKRHRQQARAQYLADMSASLRALGRVVKPDGHCCVVIGESPNRAPFLDDFRDSMIEAGFKIEARITRRVATQRSFSPQLKHEEIIVARRATAD